VLGEKMQHEIDLSLWQEVRDALGAACDLALFRGKQDINAIRLVADLLLDPLKLNFELLWRERDRAEDAEAARLADLRDHIAAMAERENRKVDAQLLRDGGFHGASPADATAANRRRRA